MRGTSLFQLYADRIIGNNTQFHYNMATFIDSYRATGESQRDNEPVPFRIRCGHTRVRLQNSESTVPTNIERCG